jgi:hypothetical protein
MKKVKATIKKQGVKLCFYSLIYKVIGIGYLLFLTGCKKENNNKYSLI